MFTKETERYKNLVSKKIAEAIFKAARACGGNDRETAVSLAKEVEQKLEEKFGRKTPTVEEIQDVVEKVLIENRHAQVAKAYILYREKKEAGSRKQCFNWCNHRFV